ncbi:SDR family oxidoreductase [Pseudonocardia sp.]|jgi:NAD(P)-dependent dehydrogenase (short-subunit alcohol dehydrogenase family)|uniref:SDR family oxidoreductase n=1 Tax=Pseudonocardia sp. TaxID=60912 RepID=UPI003D14F591
MELGMHGRTAVVCGSSKGIGRAIAEALAAEGVNVGVVARNKDGVDAVVAGIVAAGGRAVGIDADLSTPQGVERAVSVTRATFGRIEIAVSNVTPPPHRYLLDECTDADFDDNYNVLLMHPVNLTRAVVDDMRAARWGRLLNVGTILAKEWNPATPLLLSHTFRPALLGFQKSIALELGPSGITVNTLGVGAIRTERMRESMRKINPSLAEDWDALDATVSQDIPVRRLGRPEDVAALATFLCSARAGFITGQHYLIDGGAVRSL